MVKYRKGVKSGKQGDVIYSSWHGIPYERKMPESVANPRTEEQQAHRNAFAEISRLSSAMKVAHTVGLHNKAMREFLLTPEGHRMLSTGRKVAFEYAQDRLHQLYPDLDIPPFTFNKTEWFD